MRFELLSRSPRPLCRRRYDRKELHRRSAFYEDCFGQSNCVRRSNWFGLPRQSPTTNMRMAPVSRARNFSYTETNPINLCRANFPSCAVARAYWRAEVLRRLKNLGSLSSPLQLHAFDNHAGLFHNRHHAPAAIHHVRRIRGQWKIDAGAEIGRPTGAFRAATSGHPRTRRHADRRNHS